MDAFTDMLFAALSVFTDEDHEIRFGRVVLFVVVSAIALGALAWRLGFF